MFCRGGIICFTKLSSSLSEQIQTAPVVYSRESSICLVLERRIRKLSVHSRYFIRQVPTEKKGESMIFDFLVNSIYTGLLQKTRLDYLLFISCICTELRLTVSGLMDLYPMKHMYIYK